MEETYKFTNHLRTVAGYLYCEDVRIRDLQEALAKTLVQPSPVFVYSKAQILESVSAYTGTLQSIGIRYLVGYSVKANHNPSVLSLFQEEGLSAVVVSGHELQLAIRVGFEPRQIVMNGNGKQRWEVDLAISNHCLINVDSEFDLDHIAESAARLRIKGRVLLRINPEIDPEVHEFVSTGTAQTKFGFQKDVLSSGLLDSIRRHEFLELVGLHCHLGSTITNIDSFSESVDFMVRLTEEVRKQGFQLEYLNLGGGLGIGYEKHAWRTRDSLQSGVSKPVPTPKDLITRVHERLQTTDLRLILEPGRSLVGPAATLVTKVIGCKSNRGRNYIVVDGSMTEVIRPCLYGSYHHIELTEPSDVETGSGSPREQFDVVGPVCESADFLGKMRPAEVMVDRTEWTIIRHPDTFENFIKTYPL